MGDRLIEVIDAVVDNPLIDAVVKVVRAVVKVVLAFAPFLIALVATFIVFCTPVFYLLSFVLALLVVFSVILNFLQALRS